MLNMHESLQNFSTAMEISQYNQLSNAYHMDVMLENTTMKTAHILYMAREVEEMMGTLYILHRNAHTIWRMIKYFSNPFLNIKILLLYVPAAAGVVYLVVRRMLRLIKE